MALLFHQNMENYSGDYSRNRTWSRAFTSIQAQTGKLYWVAGFSELLGNGNQRFMTQWFPSMMCNVAKSLDDGLESTLIIAIGEAATGRRREYVGISWDHTRGVTVEHAGKVLLDSGRNNWTVYNQAITQTDSAVLSTIAMPPRDAGWRPDSRGVAYIACHPMRKKAKYVFGFTHNEFSHGNRSGAFASMTTIAENLRTALSQKDKGYEDATIIIGGDFNVDPPVPTDNNNNNNNDNSKKRLRSSENLNVYAAKKPDGSYVNTTASSPYDFWLSTDSYKNPSLGVYTETRGQNMSKHAAITFQV